MVVHHGGGFYDVYSCLQDHCSKMASKMARGLE